MRERVRERVRVRKRKNDNRRESKRGAKQMKEENIDIGGYLKGRSGIKMWRRKTAENRERGVTKEIFSSIVN